ncbi:unnamed protein product [Aureobasidium mustum]|uniref:Protein kinase domain-containing protein n=1 Tax=Aureobasidium mustum TaxID=2773714 RepID=A0A9N8JIK6_9PEZI|nr:unnamed protein product [Aureobasidium mustum]
MSREDSRKSEPPPGDNDRSGLPDGDWQGNHFLGKGGQGAVHYWVKVDSNQRIIDRVAIKDSWSTESTWEPNIYKGIYDELVRKGMSLSDALQGSSVKLPFYKEAYIQGLLTPEFRATKSNTVRLRGFRRGDVKDPYQTAIQSTHWRIYMDHMYPGDLYDLIRYYTNKEKPIPEPFIWWVMKCLASALVQMEDLSRARSNARKEKDETVVLVDMKPSNIFLDAPAEDEFVVYAKPVIGDFGSAHLTYKDDPTNVSNGLSIIWSRGFLAPELFAPDTSNDKKMDDSGWDGDIAHDEMDDLRYTEDEEMSDIDKDHAKATKPVLYSWTNVWQLGKTIESMMRIETHPEDRNWKDPEDRESRIKVDPPHHEAEPDFLYSEDLIDIVWRCQKFDPESRPTPADLLDMIKSISPLHVHRMDIWGTEEWISEQYEDMGTLTEDHKRAMRANIKKRADAGKLWFLHDFEDRNLATLYRELDLDIPSDCELIWMPQRFRDRIGQIFGAEESELAENPDTPENRNNKRPRSDEAITMTQTRKKPRI